jgi:hypothetical protein
MGYFLCTLHAMGIKQACSGRIALAYFLIAELKE